MPEGPEVLQYYKFVKSNLENKTLRNFNILSGRYLKKTPKNLDILIDSLSLNINKVNVKGKTIFIELDNNITKSNPTIFKHINS